MRLFEIEIGRSYKCDRKDSTSRLLRRSRTGALGWLCVTRLRPAAIPASYRTPLGSFGLSRKIFIHCRFPLFPAPRYSSRLRIFSSSVFGKLANRFAVKASMH
jgi:hypothetical protein